MISESLSLEIWDRLFQGKPLVDLPIPTKDNRLLLEGVSLPDPTIVRKYQAHLNAGSEKRAYNITEVQPNAFFQQRKWEDLDFSGDKLPGIMFMSCEIHNCKFDNCNLQTLRWWCTSISDSSFVGANLRGAALGGVHEGRRNVYNKVDFSNADMRGTAFQSAEFKNCIFSHTKLDKVDFQGSTFTDCVFEGELNEVIFYKQGFRFEALPPNEMKRVDFSRACLKSVEFRNLDLDTVIYPSNQDHIIIDNYPNALDAIVRALNARNERECKGLAAYFGGYRRWVGTKQERGIISKSEVLRIAGPSILKLVEQIAADAAAMPSIDQGTDLFE